MAEQRNIARNEHTLNILTGLAKMEALYSLTIDEMDYIEIALDVLRDINNYGVTSYLTFVELDEKGVGTLPCNVDSIEAVVEPGIGEREYGERVRYDVKGGSHANDDFYREREIFYRLGRFGARLDLNHRGILDTTFKGYIPYTLGKENTITVQGRKGRIAVAYVGISVDDQGYPLITRKQSKALAAQAAKAMIYKGSFGGNKISISMLEFITQEAGRLLQAAAIPEQITDNELDEILDAKVSFGRKRYHRYGKIGRG